MPHSRSLEREEDVEEERRLCYVGITRAQEKLYLVCARERTLYGYRQANPLSRFIKEIPGEVKEELGVGGLAQERPTTGPWEKPSAPQKKGRLLLFSATGSGTGPGEGTVIGTAQGRTPW